MEAIREKIMKCKMICLSNMDLSPFTNPKYMKPSEKKKLIKLVEQKMEEPDETIQNEFIELVNNDILGCNIDYSQYPVYIDKRDSKQVEKAEEPLYLEEKTEDK